MRGRCGGRPANHASVASADSSTESKTESENSQRRFEPEPYSISPDGHYIGCDGYVVPKNFAEFYDREPLSVLRFVMKNLRKQEVDDDAKDIEQDLLLHLQYLPEKSKYRKQGKTDIIQCFDPKKQHGANAKRFHNFISCCLTNRFNTLMAKRKKNPLFRLDTLSFTEGVQDDDGGHRSRKGEVNPEYVHKHSSVVAERQGRCDNEHAHNNRIFVEQYKDFLRKNAPDLLVVAEAISSTTNLYRGSRCTWNERQHLRPSS